MASMTTSRLSLFGPSTSFLSLALGLLVLLFAAAGLSPSAGAAGPVSQDEAVAIVTAALPGGSLDGVRLYIEHEPSVAGTVVSTCKREVFVTPAPGWFVFVDLLPAANWEHPCRYFFVDAESGELAAYEAMVPPPQRLQMLEITHGADNPPEGVSERMLAQFDEQLRKLPKPEKQTRGQVYAFIISGGADSGNNHIRYWNDCAFIYRTLVNYYGYADENIFVCISDGTNPAVDRSNGTNSPPDLDGDGDDDIQYPATLAYIGPVFNELATLLNPSDQLFIFTTDHGGSEGGWNAYLNLWNWEEMRDDQMATYVNMMPCETIVCTFEQCFSGGMLDDLVADGRIIATAARYDEYSWAMPPDYVYDTFVFHWTSAVAWQNAYGQPVDADTNDDGIVSMREAFLYAEAHDFDDETPQYSSTPSDLGDIVNLRGNMEGVYLTREETILDDDDLGASQGNGNGVVEYSETIELYLSLSNLGMTDAIGVVGTLATASPYVTLIQEEIVYGDIPSEATVMNALPFVFRVSHDVPDGADLGLSLALSEEPGGFDVGLLASAPEYEVLLGMIDDSQGGDGDGIVEPGESLGLIFNIRNTGSCPSPDLSAHVTSGDPYFTADPTPHPIGVLPAGEDVTEGGFAASVDAGCPPVHAGYLVVHMTGPDFYERAKWVSLPVGQIFADNMEAGGAQWTHSSGGGTWVDNWHLETYRNHTVGGATSWKCGGAGSANYADYCYSLLQTNSFNLLPGSQLHFWHWMNAETSPAYPGYAYDGGLLQISVNGGAWQSLAPLGGYPFLIRTGGTQTGPFTANTPVWSGLFDWQAAAFDLSAYSGPVRLRWAFGSDRAVNAEGWYVDDVQIVQAAAMETGETVEAVYRPQLMPAFPNPAVVRFARGQDASVSLRFRLPREQEVRLDLFDPAGRCIRTLAEGSFAAGLHQIPWDGRDGEGQPVGAGSYYYRLSVGAETQAGKIMVVR